MNSIPNKFYRVSIKALILDETKRFLLSLEDNGMWDLLGGGLEFGENPQNCLIRELKEEAGLTVTMIQPQPAYFLTALSTKGYWTANIIYEVKIKDLKFKTSEECIDLKFFTKEDTLKENLYPTITKFIKEFNPDNHSTNS